MGEAVLLVFMTAEPLLIINNWSMLQVHVEVLHACSQLHVDNGQRMQKVRTHKTMLTIKMSHQTAKYKIMARMPSALCQSGIVPLFCALKWYEPK